METSLGFNYDYACYQMLKLKGIRFAGIVNNRGRKIAGGLKNNIFPLESDEKKIEMLFMELSLDLSMRKEFDNSFGSIKAIVSYRDRVNIITIPIGDNFMLLTIEVESDPNEIIELAKKSIAQPKKLEVLTH